MGPVQQHTASPNFLIKPWRRNRPPTQLASYLPAHPTCLAPTPGPFSYNEIILSQTEKNDKVTHKLSCFSHCSVSDRLLEKLGEEVLLLYFCYSVLIRKLSSRMENHFPRDTYCSHWNKNEPRLSFFWIPWHCSFKQNVLFCS